MQEEEEMSKNYKSNEERTKEYFSKFSREKVLRNLLSNKEPTILDVGANMGQSIEYFTKIRPDAHIIAFEPQVECFESLNEVRQKNPEKKITIVGKAAGNKSASSGLKFYSHDASSGLSGFNRINLDAKDSIKLAELRADAASYDQYVAQVNHEREVPCVRLDEWLNDNDIGNIDLLKIDTQGYEPEVLEGMGEFLRSTKVVLTELMFYDYYRRSLSFSDIEKHLIPAGFNLFDISHISKNPMNGRTDWIDVIYLNKDRV